ncbi:Aste57867_16018 [Aphanomyces stellatus]|uniref:Aste57867_16018 protein n=1 Tax=Aphanomyces stellatus TaxID=120398 RepID=A0A485L4N1_9STRA|nr:hypothetical protein As57867_015962 [Aphanomyces stellatus]VFT92803.1 Aste57867_16018 [Aphanomyces stellatus]
MKEALFVCAAGVALASAVWVWKNSKGCGCPWCKRRVPKRMIFVRHGQSQGNVDPNLYRDIPDNMMPMTELGKMQAREAGKLMKALIGDETTRCIVSPCRRTLETFEQIMEAWGEDARHVPWTEEPRIREQDFGNFQDPDQIRDCKIQRRKFGGFFYRFPSGESPADVFDRISSFLESLHRMFARHPQENYILVTHGVAIRVLLMRYFKLDITQFERIQNFHNAEFIVLENNGKGSFNIGKLVHPSVDPETLEVKPVERTTLRLWDCSGAPKSKFAASYEMDSLF